MARLTLVIACALALVLVPTLSKPWYRETAFRTVPRESALAPQKSRLSSAAPTPRCTSTTEIPRIALRGKLVTRQQQLRQRATRAGLLLEKKVMRGNDVKFVKEKIASTINLSTKKKQKK